MSRKLVNMRLPEGLLAATDAEALRLGQTRTLFVERALESALGEGLSTGEVAADEPRPVSSRASGKPFRCPIYTCEFTAGSPAAVCGRHGRQVIPA